MRVFLDTNVLVSSFATRRICAGEPRLVFTDYTLVTSDVVLHELTRFLRTRIRLLTRIVDEIEASLSEYEVVS